MDKKDMRIAVEYAFEATKDLILDLEILKNAAEKRLKPILSDENIPGIEIEYIEIQKRIAELKRQNKVFKNYLDKN